MTRRILLPALAAALLAAGCTGDPVNPATVCPQGLILADAGEATIFREGMGRDLTDISAQIRIADVVVDCKRDRRLVTVDLQIAIAAERGPANRSGRQDVGYFVAVVDPQGNVMNRQSFSVAFAWPENRVRVGTVEDIEPRIPVDSPEKASSYQIWVGLQLDEEQLQWNRRGGAQRR
ncbi:MAG: hypothetical protein ACKOUS_10950 [Alphaproteobacteria bacterium]